MSIHSLLSSNSAKLPQAASMAPQLPPLSSNQPIVHLDNETLERLLAPDLLIPHLRTSLPTFSFHSPPHLSYMLPNLSSSSSSSASSAASSSASSSSSASNNLQLTTCWSTNPSLPFFYVRSVTVFPSNTSLKPPLNRYQSTITLLNSLTGVPVAYLDGIILSYLRVAALSGLASSLLSLPSSKTLLIIGSSNLKFHISAHRTARPSIKSIYIWSPNSEEAQDLIHELEKKEPNYDVKFHYVQKLDDEVIGLADIVCCGIAHPVVKGRLLKPGAHLDLIGVLTSGTKECDDEALSIGKVFVDFEVPKDGAWQFVDFAGTLTELAGGKKVGRKRKDEVTIFKSFCSVEVDLLAAQFAYESRIKN